MKKNKTCPQTCPRCGAPWVRPPTRVTDEHSGHHEYLTSYTCGTVTRPNWSPLIYGKDCGKPK